MITVLMPSVFSNSIYKFVSCPLTCDSIFNIIGKWFIIVKFDYYESFFVSNRIERI
jgi:hypothetical protein